MAKCDFNKVALQLTKIILHHVRSSVNLLHIFRIPFYKNIYKELLQKSVIFQWTHILVEGARKCTFHITIQKRPPETFFKKRCSQKFLKIQRKTPVPEPIPATSLKKETLEQVFSCEFCVIYKGTFFTEHLRTTASNNSIPVTFSGCLIVPKYISIKENSLFILRIGL